MGEAACPRDAPSLEAHGAPKPSAAVVQPPMRCSLSLYEVSARRANSADASPQREPLQERNDDLCKVLAPSSCSPPSRMEVKSMDLKKGWEGGRNTSFSSSSLFHTQCHKYYDGPGSACVRE